WRVEPEDWVSAVMRPWRWDNSQPVIRGTKVAWVGRVKSPANSSSRGKKVWVSCRGGLRPVTNLGRVATPRIGLPSREAMPFHTRRILKNLRNLNLDGTTQPGRVCGPRVDERGGENMAEKVKHPILIVDDEAEILHSL